MAGINPSKVYAPTPDQTSTVGAIAVAPTSTAAPTDARTALAEAWKTSGYISEDGLSASASRSTSVIKDWSKASVRTLVTEFGVTFSFNFLGVDEFALKRMLGESNVAVTAASADHGEQLKASIGAELPPVEAWCFSMKDEDRRVRVYVPRAQFTEIAQLDFKPDAGHIWGGTLTAYDDGTGHYFYVFYDDGEVVSA